MLRHLGKYNHPNIVRLMDICHGPRYDREMVLYLVFEHVDQVYTYIDIQEDKYMDRLIDRGKDGWAGHLPLT